MLNRFKVITATHKTAPFKSLGSYVLGDDMTKVAQDLNRIKDLFDLEEIYYLATCNRVIFLIATEQVLGEQFKQEFLTKLYGDKEESLTTHFQLMPGEEGVMHLFKVAGSMDSMVVGEREILRQMRGAFKWGHEEHLSGDSIRLLFKHLVKTAKHIYSNTKIGEKPVSIVSLAMQELNKSGLNHDAKILLIGAGKTNTLVSKFLLKSEYKNIDVFNRSPEGAEKLASKFDGQAYKLKELELYDKGFDVLIVCTGSLKAFITPELYRELLQSDDSEKIVIDLSVPNNVSAAVTETFNLKYICVESLSALSQANLRFRHKEVELAESMLIEALDEFKKKYKQRSYENAFQDIPSEIKAIKHHAIENVFKADMDELDDNSRELVLKMMTYMEKKCIGIPMKVARELAD